MSSRINSKTLLPAVAVLLLTKFVLLPIFSWQNEQLVKIEQLERRNAKAERLLASEQVLQQQLIEINKDYLSQADAYPRFESTADFSIETKMMFDILMKQDNLEVTQFFWRDSSDNEVFPGMFKGRFNVNFVGKLKDFALLQAKLATTEKAFKIANFGTSITKQNDKSVGEVTGVFTIEAYYWLGGQ